MFSSSNTASVAENTATDFYQVSATDANNDRISYTISGTDAARFTLSSSGQLRFTSAPDFENPTDANQDNVYQIIVTASDGQLTAQLNLSITVTNVADMTTVAQVGGIYSSVVRAITPVPGTKLIFVAQEDGSIRIVDPATRETGAVYLTVASATTLLSIAPAPDYATSGNLYVTLLNMAGDLELRRYGRLNAAAGDAASADLLFRLARSQQDRGSSAPTTGGWIGFGPDGLLYLTTATDNVATAEAQDNLAGKVLRIDVGRDDFPTDSARDYGIPAGNPFSGASSGREIFATGFRDPLRASFNGTILIVGDQGGANRRSEIDFVRPEDAGRSYGEGGIAPVLTTPGYRLSQQSFIIGGNVYRGPVSGLAGAYIFDADYTFGGIKSIAVASLMPGMTRTETDLTDMPGGPATAFGEDGDRNLYFAANSGIYVYRAN